MKNDDEKLRELFEIKEEPSFNNTIKKAKTVSIIRTITVSLMIFIVVSFILLISNSTILGLMSNKEEDNLRNWFNVTMPNAYVGSIQVDDGIMVGSIEYERYRFLGNKPMTDGSYKEGYTYMPFIESVYGDMGHYLFNKSGESFKELQEMRGYNKVGKPVMKFYHPSIKYENYINDLENLKEIDDKMLAEISISFDKAYSIEEVRDIIPKGVTLNWLWADTITKEKINNIKLNEKSTSGIYENGTVIFEEYDVYGIKTIDSQGKQIKNPEMEFINAIIKGKDGKYLSDRYKDLFNSLSNGKSEIKYNDIKIIGAVVSANVEELKVLKDKGYIKAATIGAVAEKY